MNKKVIAGIVTTAIILSLLIAFTIYAMHGVENYNVGDRIITTRNVTDYPLPPISTETDGEATIVIYRIKYSDNYQYDINDTINKTRIHYDVTIDVEISGWTDEHKPIYNGTCRTECTYFKTIPRYQTWSCPL